MTHVLLPTSEPRRPIESPNSLEDVNKVIILRDCSNRLKNTYARNLQYGSSHATYISLSGDNVIMRGVTP
jgi:hypothetical protein